MQNQAGFGGQYSKNFATNKNNIYYKKNTPSKATSANVQRLINRSNNDLLNNSNPILNNSKGRQKSNSSLNNSNPVLNGFKQKSNTSLNKSNPVLNGQRQKSQSSIDRSTRSLQSNPYSSINTIISSSNVTDNKRNVPSAKNSVSTCDKQSNINYGNLLDFLDYWRRQKSQYYTIQNWFLTLNFLVTLVMLGFTLWINLDIRFQLITDLGNELLYSSLNRIVSLLPLVSGLLVLISLLLDLSQICIYIYIRLFLSKHDERKIDKILHIQLTMAKLSYSAYQEKRLMDARGKLHTQLQSILVNFRSVTYIVSTLYFLLVLSAQFFVGLFLHFKFILIVDYQLYQTIQKLGNQYRKQQLEFIGSQEPLVNLFKNVYVNSTEGRLLQLMREEFICCVSFETKFDFWYRFGDVTRNKEGCGFHNGCLKDFVWYYVYFGVVISLATASLRFLFQTVLLFNFQFVLTEKLMKNLYEFNSKKFKVKSQTVNKESDDELDEKSKLKVSKKLQEIRRQKEMALEAEEREEERLREQMEEEYYRYLEQEIRQDEHEAMLYREGRFDELKFEQMQRKLQKSEIVDL